MICRRCRRVIRGKTGRIHRVPGRPNQYRRFCPRCGAFTTRYYSLEKQLTIRGVRIVFIDPALQRLAIAASRVMEARSRLLNELAGGKNV